VDLTVSRPVQIFALVAVIAAAGGGAMLMMKPKHAAAPPIVVTKAAATPATTTAASASSSTTTPKPVATRHTAAPAVANPTTAPVAKVPAKVTGANGLPLTIDKALRTHRIVVVSLFDPESSTDAISFAEAKAGAADAKVGFVGVSLLDNPVAAALTSALPGGALLPAPGVLVYRRPGMLVQRIDGFVDRDVVAQAAAASMTAPPITG
jgi:hypothetical protein